MHELGVAFHIISEVDKVAEQNGVKEVKSVTLEIGEVSAVIPKYIEDVWEWACEHRSTYMKNCKLNVIVIKARSYCKSCEKIYSTIQGKKCPNCGSEDTFLIEGNQVNIKSIEVA